MHLHHHHHPQNHHHPVKFHRAFAIGVLLNMAYVAIEAIYGWKVDSLALLADAAHNLGDVLGLLLAWGASVLGKVRPDNRRTYGWKRASIMSAFANACLLLFAMGSLAWEAIGRLSQPSEVHYPTVIAVACIGIVINSLTAGLFLRGRHEDLNVHGAFLHMVADALVSAGVVLSGMAALWWNWNWADPAMSLIIALVIVIGTWDLFRQSLHLLFDGVPEKIELSQVEGCLLQQPGVQRVLDLHIWAMSTSENALTAHLLMPDGHPGDEFLDEIAHQLHDRFDIDHVTIQILRQPIGHACGNG